MSHIDTLEHKELGKIVGIETYLLLQDALEDADFKAPKGKGKK